MSLISIREQDGIIAVVIPVREYGQAGAHWKQVLGKPNHGGYGRIFIQRFGANQRRYENCYDLRDYYKGCKGANIDECPGAMFIWTALIEADVEAIDAIDNQTLGRDLGIALRPFQQRDENDLWEVQFRFVG